MKVLSKLLVVPALAGVVFATAAFAASRSNDQPHMQAALSALEQARVQLSQAEHNKGGHRADAAKLVADAIGQVKQGILAGEENK